MEFVGGAAAYIGECAVELNLQDFEHVLDTVCAAISQAPVEGASYQDCARAEAERLENV